jgi:hypothetical protein
MTLAVYPAADKDLGLPEVAPPFLNGQAAPPSHAHNGACQSTGMAFVEESGGSEGSVGLAKGQGCCLLPSSSQDKAKSDAGMGSLMRERGVRHEGRAGDSLSAGRTQRVFLSVLHGVLFRTPGKASS